MLNKIIKYIFCISDEVKKTNAAVLPMKIHIAYRIILFLFLCFVIFISYGYIKDGGFNFKTLSQSILLLLFIRVIAKDYSDHVLHLLFYKKTYKTHTDEEELFIQRRKKLNKLKSKINKWTINYQVKI